MSKNTVSVVVPFYNEEPNLTKLHKELVDVLSKLGAESEIVYINDGSTDKSVDTLRGLLKDKRSSVKVKLISFRKNSGQTAAVVAGMDNAENDLVSFVDADLQNDPHDIPGFLEKIDEGYDAVFGWRKERKDATLRSFLSVWANKIIKAVFSYPYHDVGCSSRMVKREYLKDIELYGELHRIMPVLIYLKGAKITEIVVKHRARQEGKSKYGFNRILKTLIDIITVKFLSTYGTRPAYVFGTLGLGSIFIGALTLLFVLYNKFFLGVFIHLQPLFIVSIFLGLLGMQFILMGLIAELQVRTYFESQKKPIYEVKSIENY